MTVNTHEAKTKLSELIQMLKTHNEIIIANRGTPVAKLVPYTSSEKRNLGMLKGIISLPDDFDDCNEEIAEMFGL